jgi:hypothetical protein
MSNDAAPALTPFKHAASVSHNTVLMLIRVLFSMALVIAVDSDLSGTHRCDDTPVAPHKSS